METGEGIVVVRKFESVFQAFREGMCDCVRAVLSWDEFGNSCFAFAFVVVVVIVSGEHDEVFDLIDIFQCPVFIGMVCLVDFGSKEVVLCLLNIEVDMCDDVMHSDLFGGGIFGRGYNWRHDAWGLACFKLKN
jgi:hypothetical protein